MPHATRGASELEASLATTLRGEVRFDAQTRALYGSDSSNYRQIPLGVVFPVDHEDVIAAVAVCREFDAPVLGRGGGTSLAGQGCNVAVVFDFTHHMDRVLEIDPEARTARVQPGVVLDRLQEQLAVHGLMFGPDPATHGWCTIGGMIGNNSCGTHALVAGKTAENVTSLRVVAYPGWDAEVGSYDVEAYARELAAGGPLAEILPSLAELGRAHGSEMRRRYASLPRRVSGYNLDALAPEAGLNVAASLVGTESTCLLVTEATLKLIERPRHRSLVVIGHPDVYAAADRVPAILRSGAGAAERTGAQGLIGLEGFDRMLVSQMERAGLNIDALQLLPAGDGWLLAELGAGDADSLRELTARFLEGLDAGAAPRVFTEPADQALVWSIRESGLGATAHPPGERPNHEGWEDAAVPPERLGEYLRAIAALWQEFGYKGAWYGHFGQGCVHTRNDFDFGSAEGLARYRAYVERAADICVGLGGSLSGEHGDGQARGELLGRMFEPETIEAFRRFKALWDPDGRMNPGKTVDPLPLDSNLKHGPGTTSRALGDLAYALPEDGNSLGQALERCVGVGRCRSADAGSMCPSYRATGEERDSTRGRARLLAEMVRGEVVEDGWRSEEVRAALDLCLGCKGCLSDCPTHVDMAIHKSEFMYHHYAGRRRPRVDLTLSLLPWALRLGTRWPALANAVTGDGPVGRLTRRLGGITVERPTPRIAPRPFRRRGHRAPAGSQAAPKAPAGGEVVLWADTFTNAYAPDDLEHAIAILERHGLRVTVPAEWSCCGRTLYDSGRLDRARRELTRLVGILSPYVDAGMPVVVLEPSCLASFRIELPKLLADDPRAAALAGAAKSLSETLLAARDTSAPPAAAAAAAVERIGPIALHPHCHGRAIGTDRADRRLLRALGFDAVVLDSGCCGLAGSFGFKPEQKPVSDAIGRDQWLPRLRRGAVGRRLVIDGFSCHLQAVQTDADLAAGALRLNDLWWMAMAASEKGEG